MALVGSVTGSVNLGGISTFISSSNGSSVEIGAGTQVLVLSGGAASSLNPRNLSDVNFFVSGALGSAGSSTRGTSLFGGDAFISGSLNFGGDSTLPNATSRMVNSGQYAYWQNWYPTNPVINLSGKFGASLFMFQLVATDVGISGKVRIGSATAAGTARLHITASSGAASTAPIKIDPGSLLATPEAGTIEYDATNFYVTSGTTRQTILTTVKNNAAVTSSFMVSTASNMTLRVPGGGGETNRAFVMTRNGTPVPAFGNDAFLFVTGSAFTKDDAAERGVAVFAGDVVMSGNLWGGYRTFGGLNTTRLSLKGGQIILGGGAAPSFGAPAPENAQDVAVFVSGSIGSKGGATRGITLMGGDIEVSGTIYNQGITAMVSTGLTIKLEPITPTGPFAFVADVSDERLKKEIVTIDNALQRVVNSRGVKFISMNDPHGRAQVGVIAQEIQKTIPEVVSNLNSETLTVSYDRIVGVLIEAIKEQQTQIEQLKKRIEDVENAL